MLQNLPDAIPSPPLQHVVQCIADLSIPGEVTTITNIKMEVLPMKISQSNIVLLGLFFIPDNPTDTFDW